ncbi:MAG: polysaccharide deacetylase family protein [Alphaproteobacteria bacterium]|nr:polysaccharide deacetylase family protein [Alphaproteobacteria bacterium]
MFKLSKIIITLLLALFVFINELLAKENSIAVFVYHRFGENNYPSTNIRMPQFKKHLDELIKNNYNVVSIETIIDALQNNKNLPEKTVAITIDDAFFSIYKKAWPILKEKKLPFTIFVSTGPVNSNSKNYMNWEQLKEMNNRGVTIGHHTKNHFHLVGKKKETIISEIEEASDDFLKNLGYVPDIFAYPYGEYSSEIKEITKNYFKAAFGQQSGGIYNGIDIFELPRFSMNEQYGDLKRFKFAANSYGLKIKNVLPENKVITDINPPLLGFTLLDDLEGLIRCYPSHNIKADLTKLGNKRIEIRFDRAFPKGRTRINCTINDNNKWRWSGFQFLNP